MKVILQKVGSLHNIQEKAKIEAIKMLFLLPDEFIIEDIRIGDYNKENNCYFNQVPIFTTQKPGK